MDSSEGTSRRIFKVMDQRPVEKGKER